MMGLSSERVIAVVRGMTIRPCSGAHDRLVDWKAGVSGVTPHPRCTRQSRATARRTRPAEIDGLVAGRAGSLAQQWWAVTPSQSVVIYESRVCLGAVSSPGSGCSGVHNGATLRL